MLYVIAYDIANPKRLKRVAKCCELYGGRIEKSVFEIDLEDELFQQFWKEVESLMVLEEDAVIAYQVCAKCEHGIRLLGHAERPEKPVCFFI